MILMASIEKRSENTWRLTVEAGYNADGSRKRERKAITVEYKALLKTTKRLQDYLDDELKKFKFEIESGELRITSYLRLVISSLKISRQCTWLH
jgi:integrase